MTRSKPIQAMERTAANWLQSLGWTCVPPEVVPPSEGERIALAEKQHEFEVWLANKHLEIREAVRRIDGKTPPMAKVEIKPVPGVPSDRQHRYKIWEPQGKLWAGAWIEGPWKNNRPVFGKRYRILVAIPPDWRVTPQEWSAILGNIEHELWHAYVGYNHLSRYDEVWPGCKSSRKQLGY